MFGIGWIEFVLIAAVVLLVFGPEKIPEVITNVSSFLFRLKEAGRELRNQLDEEMADLHHVKNELKNDVIKKVEATYAEARDADDAMRDEARVISNEVKSSLTSLDNAEEDGKEDSKP